MNEAAIKVMMADEVELRSEASKVDLKLVEQGEALIKTAIAHNHPYFDIKKLYLLDCELRRDFLEQLCYQWILQQSNESTARHWLKYQQLEHAWKSLFK